MPIHFDFNGNADGWASRTTAVFVLPLVLLAIHLLCAVVTAYDPKETNVSERIYRLVLWSTPVISTVTIGAVYAIALGYPLNISRILAPMTGLIFIIIGNYMPKIRPNMTVGIKLPWTLNDPVNWSRTHRMAGKLWVIGGFLIMITIFLNSSVSARIMVAVVFVITVVPCIYSFQIYRKNI